MTHREVNVQWIYTILLDVQISISFSTEKREECQVSPLYTLFGRSPVNVIFVIFAEYLQLPQWLMVKAGHMNDIMNIIMLIYDKFKEVIGIVRLTDVHWAYFMWYDNSTSKSVHLGITGKFSGTGLEAFPCQSQRILGDEFFEVHSTGLNHKCLALVVPVGLMKALDGCPPPVCSAG